MNAVDIIILLFLLFGFLTGLRRGFILEVATILGAVVALSVAKVEYAAVRHLLLQVAPKSSWLTVISYLIVFLVIWSVIVTLARLARKALRLLFLGFFDRLGGAVVGVLQAALIVELLLYLGKRVPNHALHHAINHSKLAPAFLQAIPYIDRLFPHVHA
ncbi:MAG: CvpA family protein [Chloroflexota bacterium]|nr:CvpA family protein [Chloroflexota bacterium]